VGERDFEVRPWKHKALTLKAFANFSPGCALKPWGYCGLFVLVATLEELRRVFIRSLNGDPTLSEFSSALEGSAVPG
jgi:hypothetical protein